MFMNVQSTKHGNLSQVIYECFVFARRIELKVPHVLHRFFSRLLFHTKKRSRSTDYVWTFHLKTREKPSKWILAGVAMILQP